MAGYRIDYTILYQNNIGYQQIIIRSIVKYFIDYGFLIFLKYNCNNILGALYTFSRFLL